MAFWIGILIAALFAYLAFKMGFYETWMFSCNTVFAIYLAIFLKPTIMELLPLTNHTVYSDVLTIFLSSLAIFLTLYVISYMLVAGQMSVSFPKILDLLGAGLLGFFVGLLIWSFMSFLLFLTPISRNRFIEEIGFNSDYQRANVSYICRFCNPVNSLVSSAESGYTVEEAAMNLLKAAEARLQDNLIKKQPEPKSTVPEQVAQPTAEPTEGPRKQPVSKPAYPGLGRRGETMTAVEDVPEDE